MRASGKFPPFPTARTQHQHWTLQRRRTGHFKHHTERNRKLQKRNMPHLQSQRTTYHHRSQQTYHQFLRRHFQPKQEQLPGPSRGGHWDFRFCGFGYFLDGFFGFCVFFGFGSLRFADFLSFSIWFSVFTKNTNGLSDLISDTVFGFSYLTYLGSGFSSI